MSKRVNRLNSLLREVISEVIHREVKNPDIHPLTTVTQVEITSDLSQAKVHISVIGSDKERQKTLSALNKAAGFIAVTSSKKMTIRTFPTLQFQIDESAEKQARIETILNQVAKERDTRPPPHQ